MEGPGLLQALYALHAGFPIIGGHGEQVHGRLPVREGDHIPERVIRGLGIEKDWENRFPGELSGGELQRFCIARALGERTRFLLADEISTMLDLITQSQIWNFLLEETAARGIGLLVVSHADGLLKQVCTRVERLDR